MSSAEPSTTASATQTAPTTAVRSRPDPIEAVSGGSARNGSSTSLLDSARSIAVNTNAATSDPANQGFAQSLRVRSVKGFAIRGRDSGFHSHRKSERPPAGGFFPLRSKKSGSARARGPPRPGGRRPGRPAPPPPGGRTGAPWGPLPPPPPRPP